MYFLRVFFFLLLLLLLADKSLACGKWNSTWFRSNCTTTETSTNTNNNVVIGNVAETITLQNTKCEWNQSILTGFVVYQEVGFDFSLSCYVNVVVASASVAAAAALIAFDPQNPDNHRVALSYNPQLGFNSILSMETNLPTWSVNSDLWNVVKIERKGSSFYFSSRQSSGFPWTPMLGSPIRRLDMPSKLFVGIAASGIAVFQQCSLRLATDVFSICDKNGTTLNVPCGYLKDSNLSSVKKKPPADCGLVLQVPVGSFIALNFLNLNVAPVTRDANTFTDSVILQCSDYLAIFDGFDATAAPLTSKICGNTFASTYVSSSNAVYIWWHYNGSFTPTSWTLDWSIFVVPTLCSSSAFRYPNGMLAGGAVACSSVIVVDVGSVVLIEFLEYCTNSTSYFYDGSSSSTSYLLATLPPRCVNATDLPVPISTVTGNSLLIQTSTAANSKWRLKWTAVAVDPLKCTDSREFVEQRASFFFFPSSFFSCHY